MRKLTFLDSTGLRVLLRLRERCSELGCQLRLVRGAAAVQRSFDVTGLAGHFTFVDSLDPRAAPEATA